MKKTPQALLTAFVLMLALFVSMMAGDAQATKAEGGGYVLTKDTITAGHPTLQSTQGYQLQGTTGQMAVGQSEGGGYTLTSGFHAPKADQGEQIFSDGFE